MGKPTLDVQVAVLAADRTYLLQKSFTEPKSGQLASKVCGMKVERRRALGGSGVQSRMTRAILTCCKGKLGPKMYGPSEDVRGGMQSAVVGGRWLIVLDVGCNILKRRAGTGADCSNRNDADHDDQRQHDRVFHRGR